MEDGKMVRNNASTSYDVTDKSITPLVRAWPGCQVSSDGDQGTADSSIWVPPCPKSSMCFLQLDVATHTD